MLEDILRHLNNWFVVPGGVHHGVYTVENGSIALPFLQDGQFFRIIGSVFNDGLHQYPPGGMMTEAFEGDVWALAIPPAVVCLSGEIKTWREKNESAVLSPYQSESFGGYSYTKANSAGDSNAVTGWETAFKQRLNCWRKIKGGRP